MCLTLTLLKGATSIIMINNYKYVYLFGSNPKNMLASNCITFFFFAMSLSFVERGRVACDYVGLLVEFLYIYYFQFILLLSFEKNFASGSHQIK